MTLLALDAALDDDDTKDLARQLAQARLGATLDDDDDDTTGRTADTAGLTATVDAAAGFCRATRIGR